MTRDAGLKQPVLLQWTRSARRGLGNYRWAVGELSLDYERLASSVDGWPDPAAVGAALLTALAAHYEACHPDGSALHEFQQSGATYLFDLASAVALPQEDRTVAAWTVTPAAVAKRDTGYQRGFPLAPRADGSSVDRGHVIPHLSGGEFGPEHLPGKIARSIEAGLSRVSVTAHSSARPLPRRAASYFAHLIYADEAAEPSQIETSVCCAVPPCTWSASTTGPPTADNSFHFKRRACEVRDAAEPCPSAPMTTGGSGRRLAWKRELAVRGCGLLLLAR